MKNLFFLAFAFLTISCSTDNFSEKKEHVEINPIEKRICLFEGTIDDPADWFGDYFYFDDDCDLVTNFPTENVTWSITFFNQTGTSAFGSTDGYQYGNGSLDITSIAWGAALASVCISSSLVPDSNASSICCGWMSIPACCCGVLPKVPHEEKIVYSVEDN